VPQNGLLLHFKRTKYSFGWGSVPDPARGALLPTSSSCEKWRGGSGNDKKGREGRDIGKGRKEGGEERRRRGREEMGENGREREWIIF